MGRIFTDAIAREMGITNSKVQGIAKKIGIIERAFGYISDSDAQKLKIAVQIVEKDQTLLENVPKLKIAVHQELKKDAKKFYDDILLNNKKDEFIMQQFDEWLKQYDLQDYKNEIIRSNSETNLLETLKAENEKLKAELDLIEKDKLATAEIIKKIGEKYF